MIALATVGDEDVRTRVRTELVHSFFVEAGAGSGKTTVLVDRIVALVASGIGLEHIAAVTFTERAAAELRDRVRVGLALAGLDDALDELDGAAIGTLHSFARRILAEHPIEAGIPPLIEVRDEIGSRVAGDRRWDELQTELLDDPAAAPVLRLGFAAGLRLDHLRTLAHELDDNWDLIEERLAALPTPAAPHVEVGPLLDRAAELVGRRADCNDPSDKLCAQLDKVESWLVTCRDADTAQRLELLALVPGPGNGGKGVCWGGAAVVKEIKEQIKELVTDAAGVRGQAVDRVLRVLLPRIAAATLDAAAQRVAEGQLQFHDLLVLARRLVRPEQPGSSDVRDALAGRYRRLLLDESQDTDPIQIELAVRIAGGAGATAAGWTDVEVPPGALFLVGDAKQSIYRFRRADIRTYLDAGAHLGERVSLTTNFRSGPEILNWVNAVFGRLIVESDGEQPRYEALQPSQQIVGEQEPAGPPVVLLGSTPHPKSQSADEVRRAEATDIAAVVVRGVREGWQVRRRGEQPRAMSLADVTVLVPARTSIAALEAAFDAVGVSYRTEAATFVYSAPEVRELLLCARAVDDPTDELAIVATLRSSLFGCSDVDLWRWRDAGRSWNPFGRWDGDGPVADGLHQLRRWSRGRSRRSPSELLDDILDGRRVLEAAVDSPRYRETWRRLRFVVDQARAWSEAERGSLREYLRWAAGQADDAARVSETVLPETDSDAVRITTIHASKGLEFPVVVLAGLASAGSTLRPPVLWPLAGGCELNLGKGLQTLGYPSADDDEKRIEDGERRRLIYVAATRAQSHLVVSLHRQEGKACPAALVADACDGLPAHRWDAPAPTVPLDPVRRSSPPPLPPWDDWLATHGVSTAHSRMREAESATDVAHDRATAPLPSIVREGLDKLPRDLELPPWLKGRYGTPVGRAVHAVLQTIDLSTGADLPSIAASAAQAEDVGAFTPQIIEVVRTALASPTIRRAAMRPHWRETYVGTVVDDTLVEGFVDLLYRDDDGLVVVDFKTDTAISPQALSAYRTQVGVYARAIGDATAEPVARCVLLFLRPDGAVEHVVPVSDGRD